MQIDGAEGAGIIEHGTHAVIELDRRSGEAWQQISGAIDVPVTRHAEVCVQRASIVQADELMLAAALDPNDASPGEGAQAGGRHTAA